MSVCGSGFWSQLDDTDECGQIAVHQMDWGLIIRSMEAVNGGGSIFEGTLKLLALIILFASALPWSVSGHGLGDAAFMMQLSLSASLVFMGFAIYSHARRGLHHEVHLDGIQSEVRFATRNSRNAASIRRRIPMMHVHGCFLEHTKSKKAPVELRLQLKSNGQTLPIASGEERDLIPVLEQMTGLINITERARRFSRQPCPRP